MSQVTERSPVGSVVGGLQSIVRGREDTRVRAVWRVLLAMPLLWMVTGGVLAGNVQAAIGAIPLGPEQGGGFAQSVLHAGFFVLVLIPWARYFDRYPMSAYGVSASPEWVRDFFLGLAAVVVGQVAWIGLGLGVGAKTATVSPSVPEGSVLWGVVLPFVAFGLHAAVQQLVFFRVILKNAAEGLDRRGLSPERAALGAVPVAVLLFVLMHELSSALRVFDLAVVGAIYALLYLQTGELALGIGTHTGALFGGTVVFGVLDVSGSLSGALGTVDEFGFPKMILAYLFIVAWLTWRRSAASIRPGIAQRHVD